MYFPVSQETVFVDWVPQCSQSQAGGTGPGSRSSSFASFAPMCNLSTSVLRDCVLAGRLSDSEHFRFDGLPQAT